MDRTYYDDGSWAEFDANGAMTRYADTSGNVSAPDTSVLTSFLGGITNTVASVLQARSQNEAAAAAQSRQLQYSLASQQINLAAMKPLFTLALLGLGVFAVVKLVK